MALTSSRRMFLTGGASAAAWAVMPVSAGSQTAPSPANDGFRLLRATPSGFDETIPGPLLRIRQGAELKVRLRNELAQATAVYWRGVRAPSSMDGTPGLTQPKVASRANFDYHFNVLNAGTHYYQTASVGADRAEPRLFGILVVDEMAAPPVDRDIALIFDEKLRPAENIETKTNERLRLRFINAAKAQILRLRIDRHVVRVMAIDGQPAEPFLARDSALALGPGNRADLFVDAALDPGTTASVLAADSGGEKEIARLVYASGDKRRPAPLPDPEPLPANPLPQRIDLKNALRFEAPLEPAQSRIWAPASALADGFGAPLFSVKRGRAVVMAFPNQTDFAHVVHPHGHCVRLLDNLDDGWKPFWLDTILVDARQTSRVAFVADTPGKWLIECQRIGDDEATSASWFEVT